MCYSPRCRNGREFGRYLPVICALLFVFASWFALINVVFAQTLPPSAVDGQTGTSAAGVITENTVEEVAEDYAKERTVTERPHGA